MDIKWVIKGLETSDMELSAYVIKHAHEWYEWADVNIIVIENGSDYFTGGSESFHREKAFTIASEVFNIDYDVFYDAWLQQEPVLNSLKRLEVAT